jgi:hypothetical protein
VREQSATGPSFEDTPMISLFRKTLVAGILLSGLAAPALAQPYDGGGNGYGDAPRYAAPYYGDDGWRRHEEREAMWRAHEHREAYWREMHRDRDSYGYRDDGYGRPPCPWEN